jgi:hypothetical protein
VTGQVVVLLACLATTGCAVVARREAWQMLPKITTCPDREPVRLLIERHCPGGVCGYSCLPGRWE